MTSHLEEQDTSSAGRRAPAPDDAHARHPDEVPAGAAPAGQQALPFPHVAGTPASGGARLTTWEVRLAATEMVGRVVADAILADENGPVLEAHGSARLPAGSAPDAARSAANLATARALRRLAEVALRSSHEPAEALRARTAPAPGVELVEPSRIA